MLAVSKVERDLAKGHQVTMLGKDGVSAFNNLRREGILQSLREAGVGENIINYITRFLRPRSFEITWDGTKRGCTAMDQGTPQGSPRSHILWLTYLARTLKAVD